MVYDITVVIDDLPGTLARVGEALGEAGINIGGYCSFPTAGKSYLHFLVEDIEGTRAALETIGVKPTQVREAMTVEMADEPGELGQVARRIADAGVNIDMVYMGTDSKLIVAAYELEKARAAVGQAVIAS
jgi:hypothetical protein